MMSDDDPRFDVWGKNFPEYVDMYTAVERDEPFETEFGGNHSYSKLIRYPQLTVLWAGYPFSIDANEERGHFWIQVDQMDTARNNKDFLRSHTPIWIRSIWYLLCRCLQALADNQQPV